MKQERVLREVETAWEKKSFTPGQYFVHTRTFQKRERHGSSPCLLGSMGDLSHQRGSVGDKRKRSSLPWFDAWISRTCAKSVPESSGIHVTFVTGHECLRN